MQVKANSDMSAALRKAAHTMLSMGRDVLSNPLKTPTSAVALFHAGSNLLADWDLFHLRPSEKGIIPIRIADVGGVNRRTKRQQHLAQDPADSRSETSSAGSPLKKPKFADQAHCEQLKQLEAAKADEIKEIRREVEAERVESLADVKATTKAFNDRIKVLELEVKASSATVESLLKQLEVSNFD